MAYRVCGIRVILHLRARSTSVTMCPHLPPPSAARTKAWRAKLARPDEGARAGYASIFVTLSR
jgi:hypothetical protein